VRQFGLDWQGMQGLLDKTKGYYMESFDQSPLFTHIIDKSGTQRKKLILYNFDAFLSISKQKSLFGCRVTFSQHQAESFEVFF
jgi:hypothetical protein